MVRTVVVVSCLVAVAVDVMAGVGRMVQAVVAVAVAVVTEAEHSLEAVVGVEIEVEPYFVLVLRLNNWSNSMVNTHLPGLAFVPDARLELGGVGMTGVVEDVVQVVTYKRRYRALEVDIDSIGSRMLFEDGVRIGLEGHKLDSPLVVGQIEVVTFFDPMEFEIVVVGS